MWLQIVAWIALAVAGVCTVVIAWDLGHHPQKMWIMNVVWPVTALYAGPLALWAYFRVGRFSSKETVQKAKARGKEPPGKQKPFWQMVALGATHCGSGCTLADIVVEWFIFFVPLSLFGRTLFAGWVLDFILAFLFGIAFQYFTIKPMRNLSVGEGIWAAVKADTLSLASWQIGMYSWMAIAIFLIFGHEIPKTDPVFWFMMQIAMLVGFLTAYPVNWWLLRAGMKEKM